MKAPGRTSVTLMTPKHSAKVAKHFEFYQLLVRVPPSPPPLKRRAVRATRPPHSIVTRIRSETRGHQVCAPFCSIVGREPLSEVAQLVASATPVSVLQRGEVQLADAPAAAAHKP
jgi:hypothetical protein